jgi:tRNA(Ile)-lysidine synthase
VARAPAALRLVADRAARALAAARAPRAGDGLALAVSGGADSLALLHAARTLAGRRGWRLAVVTVDHGLRPSSPADAAFVADHAKTLGVEARLVALDPADLAAGRAAGPEGAARAARYQALEAAADELGCGFLATGHTLDDQAETVLLQLLRGAGPDGLAAMGVRTGRLLRPLLGVRRAETRACCAALGVRWREDESNADQRLLRNAVRARLLPLLEDLRPGAATTLARTAALAADERAWLEPLVQAALAEVEAAAGPPEGSEGAPVDLEEPGAITLGAAALAGLPVALGRRVVREAARWAGAPVPAADTTDRVLALSGSAGSPAVTWPGGQARRAGTVLVLSVGPVDATARL